LLGALVNGAAPDEGGAQVRYASRSSGAHGDEIVADPQITLTAETFGAAAWPGTSMMSRRNGRGEG
jgi:hypothetical protein